MQLFSKPAGLRPLRAGRRSNRLAAQSAPTEQLKPEQQQQPAPEAKPDWIDRYTVLKDRRYQAPLQLPALDRRQLITIVRHGQSTWNAENRVQGSSDTSVLTDKGIQQAEATRDMLAGIQFSQMWFSPLARAAKTAQLVWDGRVGPQHCDPVLREIDLYSFQGLEKSEVKQRFAMEYQRWQTQPEEFELDGHYPVFESWYRASLAWHKILASEPGSAHTLIVAHNNTNQALMAVALQLPVTFFRRFTQCNAAVSQLLISPADEPVEPPEAVLLCLNQSRVNPMRPSDKVQARVVLLVPHANQAANEATVELIAEAQVRHVLLLPSVIEGSAPQQPLASLLAARCRTAGGEEPDIFTLMQEAGNEAWQSLLRAASDDGGCNVVVIVDSQAAAGLTCSAFGLGQVARHKFNFEPGGVSVFDFNGSPGTAQAVAHCLNNRGHLPQEPPPPTAASTTHAAAASAGKAPAPKL